MKKQSFTLIELVIVIAIMMLLVGIIAPNMMQLPGGVQRDSAFAAINNAFIQAKITALALNSNVSLNASDNKIRLSVKNSSSTSTAVNLVKQQAGIADGEENQNSNNSSSSNNEDLNTYVLPNGCKIFIEDESGFDPMMQQQLFYFYPNGTARGPNNAVMQVGETYYQMVVERLTAKLNLYSIDKPNFIID